MMMLCASPSSNSNFLEGSKDIETKYIRGGNSTLDRTALGTGAPPPPLQVPQGGAQLEQVVFEFWAFEPFNDNLRCLYCSKEIWKRFGYQK